MPSTEQRRRNHNIKIAAKHVVEHRAESDSSRSDVQTIAPVITPAVASVDMSFDALFGDKIDTHCLKNDPPSCLKNDSPSCLKNDSPSRVRIIPRGPPGAGKTRFVEELVKLLELYGYEVLVLNGNDTIGLGVDARHQVIYRKLIEFDNSSQLPDGVKKAIIMDFNDQEEPKKFAFGYNFRLYCNGSSDYAYSFCPNIWSNPTKDEYMCFAAWCLINVLNRTPSNTDGSFLYEGSPLLVKSKRSLVNVFNAHSKTFAKCAYGFDKFGSVSELSPKQLRMFLNPRAKIHATKIGDPASEALKLLKQWGIVC